jgi:Leucine-rich repeat (LRR) protein
MFVQRDRRKIEEIISECNDESIALKFSNRIAEFNGNIKILCKDAYVMKLQRLKTLNLYGNTISTLQGIGMFSESELEELNLGNNSLSTIPLEFGTLQTLRRLYLEDNELRSFPIVLCQLSHLTELRLSGNGITDVPQSISNLGNLQILVRSKYI